jgi:hypothetical protein
MGGPGIEGHRPAVVFRPYQSGDESAIADLFQDCFQDSLATDHWEWKYTKNPYGNYHIMVAVAEGEVIAHFGGYPVYMEDSRGGRVRALHLGDIMTAPRARTMGVGHRSVIARVTRAFYDEFCAGKVAFNFGSPAERHLRLGQMVMSYQPVGPVFLWTKEGKGKNTGVASRPGSIFRSARWWGCTVEPWTPAIGEVAELYEKVKGTLGISLCRDEAYLQWRYLMCPGKQYRFYRVSRGKRLLLWAAVVRKADGILVGDVLLEPRNASLFSLLLEELSSRWPGLPIRLWASHSVRWWTDMLTKAEFTSAPHPWRIHTGLTVFDEEHYSAKRMQKDWFYSMGDFDLF